jgi:DNA (cytosine-5)-methyltransferase 1
MSDLFAVDIFSGAGGLTVGLKRAGFKVIAAVEVEPHAFGTYKANHPEVHAYKQDIRTVNGEFLRLLSPTGSVDLLAGCPPCQGFSSLTSKYRKAGKRDRRNSLVSEMARMVREIRPRAVMMENVPGLAQKGKRQFNQLLKVLGECGYIVKWDILQVADYGVPQNRRRLVLVGGRGFEIALPEATHARNGSEKKKQWNTLKSVIWDMRAPVTLEEAWDRGGPAQFNWHVVRNISEKNRRRLKQAKPGQGWTKIPKRLRPKCHESKDAGFSNVYGRMSWDQVPPTITGGCTTPSKGRFGHPDGSRTISVREAALIQTFPVDYHFETPHMEYACDMVGNALPCDFAEVLSKACATALMKKNSHASDVALARQFKKR